MKFEIIVVGAGNAGTEAANIISKMNKNVLLITDNIENIGELSCNPSMGGVGKTHLIREIDSLGGIIGYISTKSSIQLKKINTSKGESVNCTRSQINRNKYKKLLKILIKKKNIKIIQDKVIKILIKNNKVFGVKTKNDVIYKSKAVIVTVGTFLKSKIFIGKKKYKEGRLNEKNCNMLSDQLNILIGKSKKLKTGTPPRLSYEGLDLKNLKIQKNDFNPIPTLSSWYKKKYIKKNNCWIAKTTKKTKEIIKNGLKKSSIYNNLISGNSPRYCPSLEDKIYRFYLKKHHNIFLEPENFREFYPNGLSTSISYKEQIELVKSIKGFKNCRLLKPGYAVEYDFFSPKNLKKSLQSKIIKGLFLAGQINGTTGYEEAGAQGIVAGINSVLYIKNKKSWYPNKKNSYIGLMINDIIKKDIFEPYRIFTNKNQNKLNLRENNSNERLLKTSKILKISKNKNYLYDFKINQTFIKIYKNNLINSIKIFKNINSQIKIFFKYKNHYNLKKKIKKIFFLKNIKIFKKINFFKIKGLSREICENLNKIKHNNLSKKNNINLNNNYINLIEKYLKFKKIY